MLGIKVRQQFGVRLLLCVRRQAVGSHVIKVPNTVIDVVAMTYSILLLSNGGWRLAGVIGDTTEGGGRTECHLLSISDLQL